MLKGNKSNIKIRCNLFSSYVLDKIALNVVLISTVQLFMVESSEEKKIPLHWHLLKKTVEISGRLMTSQMCG